MKKVVYPKTIFGIYKQHWMLKPNPNHYAIFQEPQLHDTLAYTYLTLNTRSYIAMGSDIHIMTNAGFRVEE